MNELQKQPTVNTAPMTGDVREEYTAPEIHDLGDVSAITKSDGCGGGGDGGYS